MAGNTNKGEVFNKKTARKERSKSYAKLPE